MRILHAGHFRLGTVHGTHQALWQLARAQAAAGHDVTILNVGWEVPAADAAAAAAEGVRLLGYPCPAWGRFWTDERGAFGRWLAELEPDIVHLQYVRIPRFLGLARVLAAARVPFVVSLHGGLKPAEMRRHRLRKLAYWRVVERAVHRRAAGIHFVTARERDEYYATCLPPRPADRVIANVVDPPPGAARWSGPLRAAAPRLVSLGRYDIWHKGLDLAAALVRALRRRGVAAELHLFGSAVGRFERPMAALQAAYADVPLHDHGVVTGPEKFAAMARHDLYLQYSRFELFGMSLVEAMCTGMPVVVSERCDLAPELAAADAAIVIPMDPEAAAAELDARLRRPEALCAIGTRGAEWRAAHCAAPVVERAMTGFYRAARGEQPP